jgi:hypothetical protein
VADGEWGGRPIISTDDWRKGSEYGGVGGIIAPRDSGHTNHLSAREELMMIYNTHPVQYDQLTGIPNFVEEDIVPETKKIQ